MKQSLVFALSGLLAVTMFDAMANLSDADIEAALKQISGSCTQRHGYDPARDDPAGEYELAAGEREWRVCVYAGIRAELEPKSSMPDQYEQIIAQDESFTRAIEAGEMTRFERWERNRFSKQILLTNEQLAAQQQGPTDIPQLNDFMQRQMTDLLRTNRTNIPRAIR